MSPKRILFLTYYLDTTFQTQRLIKSFIFACCVTWICRLHGRFATSTGRFFVIWVVIKMLKLTEAQYSVHFIHLSSTTSVQSLVHNHCGYAQKASKDSWIHYNSKNGTDTWNMQQEWLICKLYITQKVLNSTTVRTTVYVDRQLHNAVHWMGLFKQSWQCKVSKLSQNFTKYIFIWINKQNNDQSQANCM